MEARLERDFIFAGTPSELSSVRAFVRDFLLAVGIEETQIDRLVLGVDEACTNIIRHAHRGENLPVQLKMQCLEGALEFILRDSGEPFQPSQRPENPRRDSVSGGFGLIIIEEVFDFVEYLPQSQGTILRLRKNLSVPTAK
jgi:anti-sigma regulatory factor (Ser/Thr protein kinase)